MSLSSLHGKKIIVTREKSQAKAFSDKIQQLGGIPIEVPLLKITCNNTEEIRPVMNGLSDGQWVFFTSSNGVHCFVRLLEKYRIEIDRLNRFKIAVVGEKTGIAVEKYGLKPTFSPSIYNAEIMAKEFLESIYDGEPILLIRGNRSRDVLPNIFEQLGIDFQMVEVYQTSFHMESKALLHKVLDNSFDFLTFTSPSSVEAYVELGSDHPNLEKSLYNRCVCIGTTTEQRAIELGFNDTYVPESFTIDGMIGCMRKINREDS
ncbi:uroporphyrinogen-III synthase [Oceanobacillus limi]|uniref:Uroporphyrinogen-III synthase n=1 Tax=Oceanobacillus limi TaxID=930131 RepID=A0A1I0GG09_9BACI|nr:uroporphyrinogen-III synthase [Oceanobacillus limi]SET69814.1 uroporphyrinogen-III synthase [Oceanobacillus limi]